MSTMIPVTSVATSPPAGLPPKVPCHRPWTGFELFDHLGDVRPCCWGKVSCGNINRQSPAEIWQGPGFELYRRAMQEGRLDDVCQSECPIRHGHYSELAPEPSPAVVADPPALDAFPKYMRVVPSIRC